MSVYPYEPPSFLQGQTVDIIHKRMMDSMPPDIDKSEAQIPWDYTRPAAIEKAEFVGFELNEAIKIMFVHWSYGEWLDRHAEAEGLTRRAANKASGALTVKGKKGTEIAAGFQFSTVANLSASVIFEAIEDMTMDGEPDDSGLVNCSITVQAVEGGRKGNVPPDTIILMVKPETGIAYVTNPKAIIGGTPEESDDELRERILASIRSGISFTGCDADYIRWAKEVPGVGSAFVESEWDDPSLPDQFHWTDENGTRHCAGAVRLFLIDANGQPANEQIQATVYDHIIQSNNRTKRFAPIGATLTVAAPVPLFVSVEAALTLKTGENIDEVTERFKASLAEYWKVATVENDAYTVQSGSAENIIRYVHIGARLAETTGVEDYDPKSLTVNGEKANIVLPIGQYPVLQGVTLRE